ncbi:MAG: TIGR03663 family protein [Candidatus Hydrogenedentes bacterium]|nr:TIGR03663 family protein [Candidatus Hydrogenedentota bacterium]
MIEEGLCQQPERPFLASNWRLSIAFLLIFAVAALARVPALALRPMHGDEANQAYRTGLLLEQSIYRYDPAEHHGPTLYYFTLPVAWLTGKHTFADTTETTYRLVPVLFGLGMMLLLWSFAGALGRPAILCAALLAALSPATVFYSRYYIQETILVFLTFAAIVSGWRYTQARRLHWALLTGLCIGLMHATKETCILAYAAMIGALAITSFSVRNLPFNPNSNFKSQISNLKFHFVAGLAVASAVSVLFFSSFFTNLSGPWDSIRAYQTYLGRADGAGVHDKPWYYYLSLLLFTKKTRGLWWSEAAILLPALLGIAIAVFPKPRNSTPGPGFLLLRFLAWFTILLTVIYSLIPYKTPWCVLTFLQGIILLAGAGTAWLFGQLSNRVGKSTLAFLGILCLFHLGWQSYRANYVYPADWRNPYVYAHTVTSLVRLADRVEQIAEVSPDGLHMLIKVIAPDGDYWPLPWYLRKFDHVGYWNELPNDSDADMVIVSPRLQSGLDAKIRDSYQVEFYGLRPGVMLLAYTRSDLWEKFMQSRR